MTKTASATGRRTALKAIAALGAVPLGFNIGSAHGQTRQAPFTIIINQSPWFNGFRAVVERYQRETGNTVTMDVDATVGYLKTLKAVRRDRIGVIGFCWGGGQSFRYATNNASLRAFVVCYGPGPDASAIARVRASGLGVYAENDARIDAGLADVAAAVRQYGKAYRYTVYPGVGHGFLRTREKPEVADSAWSAVVRFFRETLEDGRRR